MQKIDLKNFDLQKFKVGKKTIHIEYFDLNKKNDLVTIDSDSKPSEDLTNKLNELKEFFADSLGLLAGWNHAIDCIKANEEALRLAIQEKKSVIDGCTISGVSLVGGEDNESVIITGSFETGYGTNGTSTGRIGIEDYEGLDNILLELKSEVYLFIFKAKRADDLFNQKEQSQEGLGSSTSNLKKVG